MSDGCDAAVGFQQSVALATEAERLGYHRVWLGEHHGAEQLAGTAPEILAAWLLARTRRIRIGTGGILLQHYSPFKVAEQFRVLAALAPGRVDLGIGKAPGGFPLTTAALSLMDAPQDVDDLERKLDDLDAFLSGGPAEGHRLHGARAFPAINVLPERFLLGAGARSAALAGRLGWGFAHAGHFEGSDEAIMNSLSAYRAAGSGTFVLSVTVAITATQAEADAATKRVGILRVTLEDGRSVNVPTEEAAREFARQAGGVPFRTERRNPLVLAGTPAQVRGQLDRLAGLGVDELMLDVVAPDAASRLAAIRALAVEVPRLAAAE